MDLCIKSLQFTFQKNGTIVYKANIRNRSQSINRNGIITDEILIKWVATVKKTTNGAQEFSVFRQPDNYAVNKNMPSLPDDLIIHRNYCRYNENSIAKQLKLSDFLAIL